MGGEINNELFKKLENSDGIWEFRTKYNSIQTIFFLGYRNRDLGNSDTWNYQENSENSIKGNRQSRKN